MGDQEIDSKIAEVESEIDQIKKNDFVRFDVYTWNVEGKGSPEEIDKALKKNVKPGKHVVLLQQAKLPSEKPETSNYKWYCSETFGSAVLISNEFSSVTTVSFVQPYPEICMADIAFSEDIEIKVISCYLPPSTDYQCDELWLKLCEIIKALPIKNSYILGGDVNAQIGKKDFNQALDNGIVSLRLHHDVSNENGKKLHNLARDAHLKILSTYHRGLKINKPSRFCYTYKRANVMTQQAYIMGLLYPFITTLNNGEIWDSNYNHALHFVSVKIHKQDNDNEHIKLKINSWNIQGATPEKVDKFVNELNIPVLCVQEVFLTSDDDIKTINYEWHTSKKLWAKNVGILVKKTTDVVFKSFESISECLCTANVIYLGTEFTIFCCYFSPNNPKNKEHEEKLIELVKALPEEAHYLIAGDFCLESGKDDTLNKLRDELELTSSLALFKSNKSSFFYGGSALSNVFHDILVSKSVKKMNLIPQMRWIPFYPRCIFHLILGDEHLPIFREEPKKKGTTADAKMRVEERNGCIEQIYTCNMTYDGSHVEEEAIVPPPLDPEIVEKFKDKPPSPKQLSEILKDFVLIHGPNARSFPPASKTHMLFNSFIHNRLGKLTLEEVEIVSGDKKDMIRNISRIIWNGILLIEESDPTVPSKKLTNNAVLSLIKNIFEYSYMVKAKMSFYYKGQQPVLMKDLETAGVIKVVTKKSFPTMPQLFKYIDEALTKDEDLELMFGTDFLSEFREIELFATEKKLGWRYFKFNLEQDHFAVFKKRTPCEIRDKLLKKPQDDFKYMLFPPSGPGLDNFDRHCQLYEGKKYREEGKVLSYHAALRSNGGLPKKNQPNLNVGNKKSPISNNGNKKGPVSNKKNVPKSLAEKLMQIKKDPKAGKKTLKTITKPKNAAGKGLGPKRDFSKPSPREPVGRDKTRREFGKDRNQRPMGRESFPRRDSARGPFSRRDSLRGYPGSRPRDFAPPQTLNPWATTSTDYNGSRSSDSNLNPWQLQNLGSLPVAYNTPRSERLDLRDEDIQIKIQQQLSQLNALSQNLQTLQATNILAQVNELRENQWANQQGINQTYGANTWNDHRQDDTRMYDYENERKTKLNHWDQTPLADDIFDSKRGRVETPTLTQEPHWQSLAPLYIVYPIKVNSQIEDSSWKILEYNFGASFVENNDSSLTMSVALPLRDGTYRRHNICRGPRRDVIGDQAFQLLEKHSTIIKPHRSYLCDGDVPEYIRYKIPCQSNPRNYIILTHNETGPIHEESVDELMESFIRSANEDLFFDRDSFTASEKVLIISVAEKKNLLVRHFGDLPRIADRYICVYQKKSSYEIYDEIMKSRGFHYKYELIKDRTPYSP